MKRHASLAKRAGAPDAKSGSLSHEVVETLGRAIVSGDADGEGNGSIKTGLHRKLGVSRTTVREAVKVLTAKGLLEARPRKGTWAAGPDHWCLFDFDVFTWLVEGECSAPLLEEFAVLRLAIEPSAAAIAAVNATAEQRRAVIAVAARAATGERGSAATFHVEVLNASNNRLFMQLGKLIAVAVDSTTQPDHHEDAVDRRRVAEAILEGDPALAASAMRDLVTRGTPRHRAEMRAGQLFR